MTREKKRLGRGVSTAILAVFPPLTPRAGSRTVRAFREAAFQSFPRPPISEAETDVRLRDHAHFRGGCDDRRRGAHRGARGDEWF